jgi:hypothetical protein
VKNTNNGGPAFPAHAQCGEETGMTLRDYFAAKAMQGLLAAGAGAQYGDTSMEALARASYYVAEDMLKERAA